MDALPIWTVYVVLVLAGLLVVEVGYWLGRFRQRRTPQRQEQAVGSLVGATLALLAFLMVFLIGITSDRFDNRRRLVLTEANAIGTNYLRAGYLDEPYRSEVRQMLREYLDVRLTVAQDATELDEGISRSEAIHTQLWSRAETLARADGSSQTIALYIESLNDVIDVHTERVIAAITRVPTSIWLAVGFAATLTLMLVGYNNGLLASRSFLAVLALILVFAAVVLLMIDLDRPQEGLLRVSQQALLDLKRSINAPAP